MRHSLLFLPLPPLRSTAQEHRFAQNARCSPFLSLAPAGWLARKLSTYIETRKPSSDESGQKLSKGDVCVSLATVTTDQADREGGREGGRVAITS